MQVCPGLGHLESLRKLSDQLKIIGVTGRNGKTTTSCLIAGVLAHAGHKVGLLSTLGYFDGEDVEYADRGHAAAGSIGDPACPHGAQRLFARGDECIRTGHWHNRA